MPRALDPLLQKVTSLKVYVQVAGTQTFIVVIVVFDWHFRSSMCPPPIRRTSPPAGFSPF